MDNYLKTIKKQFNIAKKEIFLEEFSCNFHNRNSKKTFSGEIFIFQKCFAFKANVFGSDILFMMKDIVSISKNLSPPFISFLLKNKNSYFLSSFYHLDAVFHLLSFLWDRRTDSGDILIAGRPLSYILGSIKFPKETFSLRQSFPSLPQSQSLIDRILFLLIYFYYFLLFLFIFNLILFIFIYFYLFL